MKWMATVTVDQARVDRARLGEFLEALDAYDGILGDSATGAQAAVKVEADTLAEACAEACAIVSDVLGADAVGCQIVTAAAFRREFGIHPELAEIEVGDLMSVSEAAELLGVSRQAVLGRIASGTLAATKVGREWAISRRDLRPGRPGRPPRGE